MTTVYVWVQWFKWRFLRDHSGPYALGPDRQSGRMYRLKARRVILWVRVTEVEAQLGMLDGPTTITMYSQLARLVEPETEATA